MQFDEILKAIGEFGPYQRLMYLLLCLPAVLIGMHNVNSALLLYIPNYRCKIPGYENDTYEIQSPTHEYYINKTIPPDESEEYVYSQCEVYIYNASNPSDVSGVNKTLTTCSSWVFDKSEFTSTFVSEHSIVCTGDDFEVANMQMISYIGDTLGAFVVGVVADTIGRKKTLCFSIIALFSFTMGLSWSPNEAAFIAIKFMIGIASSGVYLTSFVLGMEYVGPSMRVWTGMIINFFYAFGIVLLAAIGYGLRDWFWIEIIHSAPLALFLVYWWVIPESPRWLISKHRNREAHVTIKKIAKSNGTEKLLPPESEFEDNDETVPESDKIWNLFTNRVLLKWSLVIFFNWFVVSLGYYGLSLSADTLVGDFYLNFFLTGLVEFPAYACCLLFLDRIGRKKVYVSSMILGGAALSCTIFTTLYASEDLQPLTITLAMIGKFGVSSAYAAIYVWSAEIFPTAVRNSGIGSSSTCACLGSIFSPYIADLNRAIDGKIGNAIPLIVFGLSALLGGLLAMFLPETLNTELPETIEQAKSIEREKYDKLR